MERRVDPLARLWCGAGSVKVMGGARLEPKLMNHCGPENKDTNEYGKCWKSSSN